MDTRTEINDIKFMNRIADRVARTKLTASVCTGSSLLGKAGLLDGREPLNSFVRLLPR